MTLLHIDDFEGEDTGEAVWVERTVRYLVPRKELGKPDHRFGEDAWAINTTRSALVGEPVECDCGKVAIRYGTTYVWGRDSYGKNDDRHVVPGQYCPHCDGGEDM